MAVRHEYVMSFHTVLYFHKYITLPRHLPCHRNFLFFIEVLNVVARVVSGGLFMMSGNVQGDRGGWLHGVG